MVHALEITHSFLKPQGLLVDIHPNGEKPLIEVHEGDQVHMVGYLDESDNFEEYFNADQALVEVTRRGRFTLEQEGIFTYLTHFSAIGELVNYLENEWSDAIFPEQANKRAIELMGEAGEGKEIVLRETVRIRRYRANANQDL